MKIYTLNRNVLSLLIGSIFILAGNSALAQSPKKYYKNGFYEKAFLGATKKQNKKVKLKEKHAEIIRNSYVKIYEKHGDQITSKETNWEQGYNTLIRLIGFRSKVKHPMIYDGLKNMLYDQTVLYALASKFNDENQKDLGNAAIAEGKEEFEKALKIYQNISVRHKQAEPITTLEERLSIVDFQSMIDATHIKIGDKCIAEASELLLVGNKSSAEKAIQLIRKAKMYRPLDSEEENLLTLANLIIGESWITEAEDLMKTPTKQNARMAHDLLNKARSKRTLTPEQEDLFKRCEDLGMTRVLVEVKGESPKFDSNAFSGHLNKKKPSRWLNYFVEKPDSKIDYNLLVNEGKPVVTLGKVRRRVEERTKTVEYWEEVTDSEGNTSKVKKTKQVSAMVIILSRTKTAQMSWTAQLTNPVTGAKEYSEVRVTKKEITHEFASLQSGDILALPENIETDVDLDSQPFPTDAEMINDIQGTYLSELTVFLKFQKDHMRNVNEVIE